MDCIKLEQYIASYVGDKQRIRHLYATAWQTKELVDRFVPSVDPEMGYLVGLWHDVAREWEDDALLAFCKTHAIAMKEEERKYPLLLHGPVAAYLLEEVLLEKVPLACQVAIRWHTLGSTTMGRLGAALYIADYVEPLRNYLTLQQRQELLAKDSLEQLCLQVVLNHKDHLRDRGKKMATSTSALLDFLEMGEEFPDA